MWNPLKKSKKPEDGISIGVVGLGRQAQQFLERLVSDRRMPEAEELQKVYEIRLVDNDIRKPALVQSQLETLAEGQRYAVPLDFVAHDTNLTGYDYSRYGPESRRDEAVAQNFLENLRRVYDSSHVVFFFAGQSETFDPSRGVATDRRELFDINSRLYSRIFKEAVANNGALNFIFANPADSLGFFSLLSSNLPAEKVGSVVHVDSVRIEETIREFCKKDGRISRVDGRYRVEIPVVGIHKEGGVVPLYSIASVNGVDMLSCAGFVNPAVREEVLRKYNMYAKEISLVAPPNVLHPSLAVLRTLEAVLNPDNVVNISTYLKLSKVPGFEHYPELREDKGLFLGVPCRVQDFRIVPQLDLFETITEEERKAIVSVYLEEARFLEEKMGKKYTEVGRGDGFERRSIRGDEAGVLDYPTRVCSGRPYKKASDEIIVEIERKMSKGVRRYSDEIIEELKRKRGIR